MMFYVGLAKILVGFIFGGIPGAAFGVVTTIAGWILFENLLTKLDTYRDRKYQ